MAHRPLLNVFLFLVPLFCAGVHAGTTAAEADSTKDNPLSMTKIVFRNITPGIDPNSYDAQPVTVYLCGDSTRVEEQPDLVTHLHGLMIVQAGETWSVNLLTNTANYHQVDKEYFDMSIPLIPQAKQDMRFAGPCYGTEIDFMRENGSESTVTIDGRKCVQFQKDNNGITFLLTCTPDPLTPCGLTVSAGSQEIYRYSFEEYQRDLPADLSLFQVPANVKITPRNAEMTPDALLQEKREKSLLSAAQIRDPLPLEKRCALACSGILWRQERGEFNSLAGQDIRPESIESLKKYLADEWNINSRQLLFQAIGWFTEGGGHRAEFDHFGKRLAKLSTADVEDILEELKDSQRAHAKMKIIADNYRKLQGRGIVAWDYSAAICLSRWGYACGYLTEKEAWYFILPLAQELNQAYSSWEDLAQGSAVGRSFWAADVEDTQIAAFTQAYLYMTMDPQSPWKTLPWKTN